MLKMMTVGLLQANCFLLGCPKTQEGAVIDPGDEAPRIVREIAKAKLTIRYILLTHGHFDHTQAADELRQITKAPVLMHALDARGSGIKVDGFLAGGQELTLGTYTLRVIHTPGHSPGGVSIFAPGVVFTGDTLFAGSIGRTDFGGGDQRQLLDAVVKKIFPLGDDLRVYPGHGPTSTIGRERRSNPFFAAYSCQRN
jgi:hydroxyacylglutathione hydrolase